MPGVGGHTRAEAMTPLRVDLEGIRELPAPQAAARRVDPGLFPQFARRGGIDASVAAFQRSGHRLPESGTRRALDQQHLEIGGMHHHQHRFRQLEAHGPRNNSGRESLRAGSMNTAKNGLPRPARNSALEAKTAIRMPSRAWSRASQLRQISTVPPALRHDT